MNRSWLPVGIETTAKLNELINAEARINRAPLLLLLLLLLLLVFIGFGCYHTARSILEEFRLES